MLFSILLTTFIRDAAILVTFTNSQESEYTHGKVPKGMVTPIFPPTPLQAMKTGNPWRFIVWTFVST